MFLLLFSINFCSYLIYRYYQNNVNFDCIVTLSSVITSVI